MALSKMIRLMVFHHTGAHAANLIIARRLARKIRGARRSGRCVLVDCEGAGVSPDFLQLLVKSSKASKVKFCGLPIPAQLDLFAREAS